MLNFWYESEKKNLKTVQIGGRWLSEAAGGTARYYMDLFNAFLEQGDVGFRGLVLGTGLAEKESGERVRAFAEGSASLINRLYAARVWAGKLLDSYRPNIVGTHFAMFAFPMLDHLRKFPHVVHFHGPWAYEVTGEVNHVKRQIEKTVYRRATQVICLSMASKDVLINNYDVPQSRITVIPGCVDTNNFNTLITMRDARAKLGWPMHRQIVLTVRRLTHLKGLPQLILAIERVKETHPDVLLVIAGDGELRDDLERLVTERGLANYVYFAGRLYDDKLPLAYKASNISIVPSQYPEPFGLVILESMASGTPCLVTPVGGMPEIVRPLDRNLILGSTSIFSIAHGIQEWLDKNVTNGYRYVNYVNDNYNRSTIAGRIRSVYEKIM